MANISVSIAWSKRILIGDNFIVLKNGEGSLATFWLTN